MRRSDPRRRRTTASPSAPAGPVASVAPAGSGPVTGTGVRVVLVTAPDEEVARTLARELLEGRLAACVNLVRGVQSIYRWEGELQEDAEVLMVIKTSRERQTAVTAMVRALHPYDVPEVLVLPAVGGSDDYLRWVRTESIG